MAKGRLRTTEEFIRSSIVIHKNKYDYSQVVYKNGYTKVDILCPVHGVFSQTPKHHLKGNGCLQCARILRGIEHRKYDADSYFKTVHDKYGDDFDYSRSVFTTLYDKIQIRCRTHDIVFFQIAGNHLIYRGCPECKKNAIKLSQSEFLDRARKIHGDTYDYSCTVYENQKTKINIICRIHGKFFQNPGDHLQGNGCPICASKKTGMRCRTTQQEFLDKATSIHGAKYDYSSAKYVDAYTKVNIICPKHGQFQQKPVYHLMGCGCPKCNASKGETFIRAFLSSHQIEFYEQYTFEKCRHKAKLRFDFFIPKWSVCIEFDGLQHKKPRTYWGGQPIFEETQKRDRIKNEFCGNNGIHLIRLSNLKSLGKDMETLVSDYEQKGLDNSV